MDKYAPTDQEYVRRHAKQTRRCGKMTRRHGKIRTDIPKIPACTCRHWKSTCRRAKKSAPRWTNRRADRVQWKEEVPMRNSRNSGGMIQRQFGDFESDYGSADVSKCVPTCQKLHVDMAKLGPPTFQQKRAHTGQTTRAACQKDATYQKHVPPYQKRGPT